MIDVDGFELCGRYPSLEYLMMEAIKGVVRGNQRQSAQTTQYLMSKAIRFHRRQSEVLKRPFGVIRSSRGNSGSSEILNRQ